MIKFPKKQQEQMNKALYEISTAGDGIKESVIDWANIGKNAKYKAKEALRKKCSKCGK